MEECDGRRSLDDLFAAFAYKGGGKAKPTTDDPRRRALSPSGAIQRCGGGNYSGGEEADGDGNPLTSNTVKKRKNNRKKILPPPSSPSSYLRTTVRGETRVVSRYFPLPPGASPPVAIDKKVIEREMEKKIKQSMKQLRLPRKRKAPIIQPPPSVNRPKAEGETDSNINVQQPKKQQQKRKRKNPSPQLSAAEKWSDAYRRVSADHMWEPPPSCHNLLQERYSFDPWRVLIICMLLNITSGKQVKKVLPGLFLLCPDAETATKIPDEEIEKVIQTLGLQKKRAKMIKQFSCEYLGDDWTHVTQLHGIGKYAADAYAIFCQGKPKEVVPQDHKLLDYWKFVLSEEGNG